MKNDETAKKMLAILVKNHYICIMFHKQYLKKI